MPRLSPGIIRRARQYHAFLPLLLGPCRDLQSAKNELRWLHEKALELIGNHVATKSDNHVNILLRRLVLKRAKGVPLQYVIGNQPFGHLEILCRKGVLIPRPETESITYHLCRILQKHFKDQEIKILDLCTGSGCISLLMYALLSRDLHSLDIIGVDSSPNAVALANQNLVHNEKKQMNELRSQDRIKFTVADVFASNQLDRRPGRLDVLISNPPYVSPHSFNTITERSVRKYEPITALVPPFRSLSHSGKEVGDSFYPRILEIAKERRAKFVLLEVSDIEQAKRVVELALEQTIWSFCSIWRDWPEQVTELPATIRLIDRKVEIRGSGKGRAVFLQSVDHDSSL